MDILQKPFGKANFRDGPPSQAWETGTEAAGTWQSRRTGTQSALPPQSRIHLASPKFHLGPASTRSQDTLQGALWEQS